MLIESRINKYRRIRPTASSTDASYPPRVSTLTKPSGDGVILNSVDSVGNPSLKIVPFGVGSANDTFAFRVLGWSRGGQGPLEEWFPITLCEITATLGTAVGAGGLVLALEKFCDTFAIVGTSGNLGLGFEMVSPADNTIGYVMVGVRGSELVEIIFDIGAGTNANALVAWL